MGKPSMMKVVTAVVCCGDMDDCEYGYDDYVSDCDEDYGNDYDGGWDEY